jgi:benzodiazapine receptor
MESTFPYSWRPTVARQVVCLVGAIVACFVVAGVGGALTNTSLGDWYPALTKPAWTPPDWIFGPVWTLLYLMMAVAVWLVWRASGWPRASGAIGLFAGQLALNLAWSGVFFGLRSPGWAALEIVFLWLAIAATAVAFRRHSRLAAALLLPYLAWTTFAGGLNWAIFWLNR